MTKPSPLRRLSGTFLFSKAVKASSAAGRTVMATLGKHSAHPSGQGKAVEAVAAEEYWGPLKEIYRTVEALMKFLLLRRRRQALWTAGPLDCPGLPTRTSEVRQFRDLLRSIGFAFVDSARRAFRNTTGARLYYLVFASLADIAARFWKKVSGDEQMSLL